VVLEIDVQGAEQVKAVHPDALTILLLPPSRQVQAERLRRRGDPARRVQERLALSEIEEDRGRLLADAVIVNDDLDRAVEEVAGILARHRRSLPGEPA
jgi:guanylate kinase